MIYFLALLEKAKTKKKLISLNLSPEILKKPRIQRIPLVFTTRLLKINAYAIKNSAFDFEKLSNLKSQNSKKLVSLRFLFEKRKQIRFVKNKTAIEKCFWNQTFDKGRLKNFVIWFLLKHGEHKTIKLVEELKNIGFQYATKAGISLGIEDLKIPEKKYSLMMEAEQISVSTIKQYKRGEITGVERFQRLIDTWHRTSERLKQEVIDNFEATDILNPVYMMAFSGARGNISQVRQLVGMRGLMSNPQGQILDFPIRSNFREGLTLTEYIISSYGARKGIVDTALRTANAGYLTRRLVDVAQHVIISNFDCGTKRGIFLTDMKEGNKTIYSLQNRIIGRVLARDIYSKDKKKIASRNIEISVDLANTIALLNKKVFVRSSLTCQTKKLVCQLCYGWSLAQGNLVSIGEAIGVVAAQSIGEPGTQLTMRTFHTGGVFSGDISEQIKAPYDGIVEYDNPIAGTLIRTPEGKIGFLTKNEGSFMIHSLNRKETKKFKIPFYTLLFLRNGERVYEKEVIAQISSINRQNNRTDQGLLTIKAELSGQFYSKIIDLKENKIGPKAKNQERDNLLSETTDLISNSNLLNENAIDTVFEAWGWGYVWVLSGKVYKLAFSSSFFPILGDYLNKRSYMTQIKWNVASSFGTSFKLNMPFNQRTLNKNVIKQMRMQQSSKTSFLTNSNFKELKLLKSELISFQLSKIVYKKMGYFVKLTKPLFFTEDTSFLKKEKNFLLENSSILSPNDTLFLFSSLFYNNMLGSLFGGTANKKSQKKSLVSGDTDLKNEVYPTNWRPSFDVFLNWFPKRFSTKNGGLIFIEPLFVRPSNTFIKNKSVSSSLVTLPSLNPPPLYSAYLAPSQILLKENNINLANDILLKESNQQNEWILLNSRTGFKIIKKSNQVLGFQVANFLNLNQNSSDFTGSPLVEQKERLEQKNYDSALQTNRFKKDGDYSISVVNTKLRNYQQHLNYQLNLFNKNGEAEKNYLKPILELTKFKNLSSENKNQRDFKKMNILIKTSKIESKVLKNQLTNLKLVSGGAGNNFELISKNLVKTEEKIYRNTKEPIAFFPTFIRRDRVLQKLKDHLAFTRNQNAVSSYNNRLLNTSGTTSSEIHLGGARNKKGIIENTADLAKNLLFEQYHSKQFGTIRHIELSFNKNKTKTQLLTFGLTWKNSIKLNLNGLLLLNTKEKTSISNLSKQNLVYFDKTEKTRNQRIFWISQPFYSISFQNKLYNYALFKNKNSYTNLQTWGSSNKPFILELNRQGKVKSLYSIEGQIQTNKNKWLTNSTKKLGSTLDFAFNKTKNIQSLQLKGLIKKIISVNNLGQLEVPNSTNLSYGQLLQQKWWNTSLESLPKINKQEYFFNSENLKSLFFKKEGFYYFKSFNSNLVINLKQRKKAFISFLPALAKYSFSNSYFANLNNFNKEELRTAKNQIIRLKSFSKMTSFPYFLNKKSTIFLKQNFKNSLHSVSNSSSLSSSYNKKALKIFTSKDNFLETKDQSNQSLLNKGLDKKIKIIKNILLNSNKMPKITKKERENKSAMLSFNNVKAGLDKKNISKKRKIKTMEPAKRKLTKAFLQSSLFNFYFYSLFNKKYNSISSLSKFEKINEENKLDLSSFGKINTKFNKKLIRNKVFLANKKSNFFNEICSPYLKDQLCYGHFSIFNFSSKKRNQFRKLKIKNRKNSLMFLAPEPQNRYKLKLFYNEGSYFSSLSYYSQKSSNNKTKTNKFISSTDFARFRKEKDGQNSSYLNSVSNLYSHSIKAKNQKTNLELNLYLFESNFFAFERKRKLYNWFKNLALFKSWSLFTLSKDKKNQKSFLLKTNSMIKHIPSSAFNIFIKRKGINKQFKKQKKIGTGKSVAVEPQKKSLVNFIKESKNLDLQNNFSIHNYNFKLFGSTQKINYNYELYFTDSILSPDFKLFKKSNAINYIKNAQKNKKEKLISNLRKKKLTKNKKAVQPFKKRKTMSKLNIMVKPGWLYYTSKLSPLFLFNKKLLYPGKNLGNQLVFDCHSIYIDFISIDKKTLRAFKNDFWLKINNTFMKDAFKNLENYKIESSSASHLDLFNENVFEKTSSSKFLESKKGPFKVDSSICQDKNPMFSFFNSKSSQAITIKNTKCRFDSGKKSFLSESLERREKNKSKLFFVLIRKAKEYKLFKDFEYKQEMYKIAKQKTSVSDLYKLNYGVTQINGLIKPTFYKVKSDLLSPELTLDHIDNNLISKNLSFSKWINKAYNSINLYTQYKTGLLNKQKVTSQTISKYPSSDLKIISSAQLFYSSLTEANNNSGAGTFLQSTFEENYFWKINKVSSWGLPCLPITSIKAINFSPLIISYKAPYSLDFPFKTPIRLFSEQYKPSLLFLPKSIKNNNLIDSFSVHSRTSQNFKLNQNNNNIKDNYFNLKKILKNYFSKINYYLDDKDKNQKINCGGVVNKLLINNTSLYNLEDKKKEKEINACRISKTISVLSSIFSCPIVEYSLGKNLDKTIFYPNNLSEKLIKDSIWNFNLINNKKYLFRSNSPLLGAFNKGFEYNNAYTKNNEKSLYKAEFVTFINNSINTQLSFIKSYTYCSCEGELIYKNSSLGGGLKLIKDELETSITLSGVKKEKKINKTFRDNLSNFRFNPSKQISSRNSGFSIPLQKINVNKVMIDQSNKVVGQERKRDNYKELKIKNKMSTDQNNHDNCMILTKKDQISYYFPDYTYKQAVLALENIKKKNQYIINDIVINFLNQATLENYKDHQVNSLDFLNNPITQNQKQPELDNKVIDSNVNTLKDKTESSFENDFIIKLNKLPVGMAYQISTLLVGDFIVFGDRITPNVAIPKTGQIIHINNRKITIRLGQPIFVSPKAIFHKFDGDFIDENSPVITLSYQQLKTGDIIQGIPKVEQFFEARTTKRGRLFRDSVSNLLKGLFKRYRSKLPLDQAVRQSFYKIQQIIVDGVQRVYRSQGVTIADKHLEIIVKQMTSKVKIIEGGQTGFFPGEIVDLDFVEQVNSLLMKKITYEPLVLGITKASLEVDSFLSAASFQQTTKVLSKAAISRKKDFLKGLKENVILGNLIPAGTGYLIYLDNR